ncbi:unnamed protein product [Brachionus calyciflorus]|uniref:Transmembrane protein n=1 Tax=Brachionus calyciflorus TaxID=104777 RepID=A0A813VJF1_9BILA|nr:unnamed protein product [Brachionus calyciflorus]
MQSTIKYRKKTPIKQSKIEKVDFNQIDDNDLISKLLEKEEKIVLPRQTKKKLLSQLLANQEEKYKEDEMSEQQTVIRLNNNIPRNIPSISSFGRIAAFWDFTFQIDPGCLGDYILWIILALKIFLFFEFLVLCMANFRN